MIAFSFLESSSLIIHNKEWNKIDIEFYLFTGHGQNLCIHYVLSYWKNNTHNDFYMPGTTLGVQNR